MPVSLNPYALTSLAAAKEHLGIPSSTATYDDLIKRFINEATGRIETYCDRKFRQRLGVVELQDGFSQNRLLLDQWPASKPSELWVDASGAFVDVTKKLPTTAYELDVSARGEGVGVVLRSGVFPRGIKNIKIVYAGGYDVLPDELEGACLWTVQFLYDMRTERTVGLESKGKNQENTTYRGDLPEYVMSTLAAYRRAEWPTGDRQTSTR